MIAVRARSSARMSLQNSDPTREFGDLDSSEADEESVNDAIDDDNDENEMVETFQKMKLKQKVEEEEKLTDSDREILNSMQELKNHSWEPVDSLVASLGQGTMKKSALKKSRSKRMSASNKKREVSFQTVVIREYSMVLGDNPSCSYGPPVQLGWEFEQSKGVTLDHYEKFRAKRRTMRQMVLSYYKRCEILEKAGHSPSEVRSVTRKINKAKRQRDTTKFFMPVMGVESAVRSAGRKIKRATSGGSA